MMQLLEKSGKHLLKKPQIDFWLDDKDFIPKALGLFGMKPEYGKFAMCTSAVNILFLPYIDGTVLPVREDGIYPNTALNGKINPIEEKSRRRRIKTCQRSLQCSLTH